MSNFKERQASAKKVIQLQNEILTLKQKLSTSASPELCKDCEDCSPCEDCLSCKDEVELLHSAREELVEEIASLKADLKKLRSENTRLKKKIKDAPSDEES
jgi:DNA replication protein DnaC